MTPLMSLVHDHCVHSVNLDAWIYNLEAELEDKGQLDESMKSRIARARGIHIALNGVIDRYYLKAKEEGK